uniref:Uncharacterized protein n=1 Tax=Arundo donax TaxID=35708 RepID=A0A0A9GS01_ARUDO
MMRKTDLVCPGFKHLSACPVRCPFFCQNGNGKAPPSVTAVSHSHCPWRWLEFAATRLNYVTQKDRSGVNSLFCERVSLLSANTFYSCLGFRVYIFCMLSLDVRGSALCRFRRFNLIQNGV